MAKISSYPSSSPIKLTDKFIGTATEDNNATKNFTVEELFDFAFHSGTFLDTTQQLNGGATVANQVRINTTQQADGFTLGPNDRINVVNTGVYYIGANFQLAFSGGASSYNVTVWYTINDVIVPNSSFTFTTTSAQVDQTLASITDTISLNANDYLKFYWWSPATGMSLLATAAGTNPTRPLSPSVNINIFNVGQF